MRQHYKREHWAPCRNQTLSWYDWKIVESDVKPEYTHTHTKLLIHSAKGQISFLLFLLLFRFTEQMHSVWDQIYPLSVPREIFLVARFCWAILGCQSFQKGPCWRPKMSCNMTKPTKWQVRPAKTQISLGIRPVWSDSSLGAHWVAKDPSFLHADGKDSDQTGQMPRLIWVFAGPTCQFEGFVTRQLKCIWHYALTTFIIDFSQDMELFSCMIHNMICAGDVAVETAIRHVCSPTGNTVSVHSGLLSSSYDDTEFTLIFWLWMC